MLTHKQTDWLNPPCAYNLQDNHSHWFILFRNTNPCMTTHNLKNLKRFCLSYLQCTNLLECRFILLTWYCTKLQLAIPQYNASYGYMFCIWMLIHQPGLRRLFSWTVLLLKICAPPPPYFAHYFEAKVGRGHLLEYSVHLVRIPFSVPHNLEYGQGWQSRQLLQKKTAASLNVHCGQSASLVLQQRRGI